MKGESISSCVSGQGPFQCQKGIIRKGGINRNILRHKPDQQKVREAVTRTKPGQSLIDEAMWNLAMFISERLFDQRPFQIGL